MDQYPNLESSVWPPPPSNTPGLEDVTLDALSRFRIQNVWMILLLAVITLGIYPVVWLRRQTVILNQVQPDRAVTMVYGSVVLAVVILSAVLDIASAFGIPKSLDTLSNDLDRVAGIMVLVLTYQVRNRFNVLFTAVKGDVYWFNGLYTWLLNVLYLQYHLNKSIQRRQAEAGLAPLG